ncbi:MAG: putative DNA-binding domain-containing protein [Hyphomicrobiales bacterium]|nr:putative DNA-binding domain-containing protein [Hyphomicrobiales bacterium]
MNGAIARSLRESAAPAPHGLATWNGSAPEQRFAIYRNNVVVSLCDALAAKFPLLQKMVGDDYFRALARAFMAQTMPTKPRLALYGDGFADFLANFPPLERWPYLADIARLEAARLDAYHAADARPLAAHDFAGIDALPDARLQMHPSLHLLSSPFAILTIAQTLESGGDCAAIDPFEGQRVIVVRPQGIVRMFAVAPATLACIAALQEGATIAKAAACAQNVDVSFDVGAAFHLIVAQGLAAAIFPEKTP